MYFLLSRNYVFAFSSVTGHVFISTILLFPPKYGSDILLLLLFSQYLDKKYVSIDQETDRHDHMVVIPIPNYRGQIPETKVSL